MTVNFMQADAPRLPKLFMRTVLHYIGAFPARSTFALSILSRVNGAKVWNGRAECSCVALFAEQIFHARSIALCCLIRLHFVGGIHQVRSKDRAFRGGTSARAATSPGNTWWLNVLMHYTICRLAFDHCRTMLTVTVIVPTRCAC